MYPTGGCGDPVGSNVRLVPVHWVADNSLLSGPHLHAHSAWAAHLRRTGSPGAAPPLCGDAYHQQGDITLAYQCSRTGLLAFIIKSSAAVAMSAGSRLRHEPTQASCLPPPDAGEIPRVVHQSWHHAQVPPLLAPLTAPWRALKAEGWAYHLWTDEQNERLWAEHLPQLMDVYAAYNETAAVDAQHAGGAAGVTRSAGIRRADASRLAYMYVHGGVYADLDVVPCGSLVERLRSRQLILVREPGRGKAAASRYITNFWMASVARHPFWWHALSMLRARSRQHSVMSTAGPYFLVRC